MYNFLAGIMNDLSEKAFVRSKSKEQEQTKYDLSIPSAQTICIDLTCHWEVWRRILLAEHPWYTPAFLDISIEFQVLWFVVSFITLKRAVRTVYKLFILLPLLINDSVNLYMLIVYVSEVNTNTHNTFGSSNDSSYYFLMFPSRVTVHGCDIYLYFLHIPTSALMSSSEYWILYDLRIPSHAHISKLT